MRVVIKETIDKRFYVEINAKNKAVFKTMSFKNRDNAREYACEIIDTLTDKE